MVTVCVGILAALILPDWPSTSKFLTEEERALAVKRLAIEVGSNDEEKTSFLASCKMCFSDYKVWLFCLAMYCHNVRNLQGIRSIFAYPRSRSTDLLQLHFILPNE
jgi:hypothetical protein